MITVENLTKSFTDRSGTTLALDNVTIDVPPGSIFGIVGPTGSGKSVLARVISLQERPDHGAVRLDGANVLTLGGGQLRAARRQIGVVPPQSSLLRQRTVAGNIALPLEQAGIDGPQRRTKVGELLDLVGLTDRAADPFEELSQGQRARVAVARALANNPAVLLADDPAGALESGAAGSVLTVLDRVRAEKGVTVVLTTQDAGPVRRICDDVAVLDAGRVVEQGSLLDLIANPDSRGRRRAAPAGADPRRWLRQRGRGGADRFRRRRRAAARGGRPVRRGAQRALRRHHPDRRHPRGPVRTGCERPACRRRPGLDRRRGRRGAPGGSGTPDRRRVISVCT
jgi:D-methionine transport system ATP-binding protein